MSDVSWRPDLHERLARRDDRRVRTLRAAAAAAAAASVGWIVDMATAWHVVAVFGAAAAAGAWPTQRGLTDAFRTIADQAGLAYQTHVEYVGRDDPHGLLSAAQTQARLSIRGVVPPPHGAWWLPLAALATALVILTAFVGGPGSWFRGDVDTPVGGAGGPTSPPPVVRDEGAAAIDEDTATDAIEAPEPTAPGSPAATPDRGAGPSADDGGDGDGGGALERDELDRFLEALRERPSVSEAAEARSDADRDGVRDDGDADLGAAEVRGDVSDTVDDGQRTPDQRSDDEGDGERSVEVPAGAGTGEDDGEAGDPDDLEGAEAGASDAVGPDEGEEGSAPDGEQPGEVPTGVAEGDADDAPAAGGGVDEPSLDAGTGDEGGIGPGAPSGVEGEVLEPGGELEALPGILGPGPETVGGRVRLPGRDSDIAPTAVGAERFERAVEQAVTDGSVPVPYQEIIRNYFR